MESTDRKYRILSIRITTEDFSQFEQIQRILEDRAKKAGLFTSMKKPDVLKHLIKSFFESNQEIEGN